MTRYGTAQLFLFLASCSKRPSAGSRTSGFRSRSQNKAQPAERSRYISRMRWVPTSDRIAEAAKLSRRVHDGTPRCNLTIWLNGPNVCAMNITSTGEDDGGCGDRTNG